MTAQELKAMAEWLEHLDISECGEWRQAKHLQAAARVLRAVAKLEEMPRSHTDGWHIQSGSNFTLLSNFGCSIEDKSTIIATIENYKEQQS